MELIQIILDELKENFSKLPDIEPYETIVYFDEGSKVPPTKMWIAYKYDVYIIAYEPIGGLWHALETDNQHLVGGFNCFNDVINAV